MSRYFFRPYINLDNGASTPTFEPIWTAVRQTWRQPNYVQQAVVQAVKSVVADALGAPSAARAGRYCSAAEGRVSRKWDLTAIYSSDAAWREAKRKFTDTLAGIEAYQGTLNKSAERLAGCLDLLDRLNVEFARMFAYANVSLDQDMRVASNAALQQETDQLGAMFGEKTAFIGPEILAIDSALVRSFLGSDRKLDPHRQYLDDLRRRQAHTGTEGEEIVIAAAELMSDAPSNIRDLLINADFPYSKVTLADGRTVTLDPSEFSRQRRSPIRENRKASSAASRDRGS